MQDWLIAVGIHRKSEKPALRDGFPFSGQERSQILHWPFRRSSPAYLVKPSKPGIVAKASPALPNRPRPTFHPFSASNPQTLHNPRANKHPHRPRAGKQASKLLSRFWPPSEQQLFFTVCAFASAKRWPHSSSRMKTATIREPRNR